MVFNVGGIENKHVQVFFVLFVVQGTEPRASSMPHTSQFETLAWWKELDRVGRAAELTCGTRPFPPL